MQLTRSIHRLRASFGTLTATSCEGRVRTWGEFSDRVARLANGLHKLGVQTGDRVAILSLNSDHYLETFYGVLWAGAVIVPLNTRWSVPENRYALEDSGAAVLVVDKHFQAVANELQLQCPLLRHVIPTDEEANPSDWLPYESLITSATPCDDARRGGEDLAGLFYTGGTTGVAKGVMVPHRGLVASALALLAPDGFDDESVLLHIAPMFHMADASTSVTAMLTGASHVMLSHFDPVKVLETIEREGVTHLPLVPTILQRLLEHPDFGSFNTSSLRCVAYGGASITESLLKTAIAALPNCRFVQRYGQTELSPMATVLEAKHHALTGPNSGHLQSAGRATVVTEVAICNPDGSRLDTGAIGEITVSGPVTMLGYWNKPEETRRTLVDGWVRTGDAGYLDADGFLHVVDRLKDMIISGGENIYAAEVENALATHPSVASCIVIGVPDDRWGETVLAQVILHEHASATAGELIAHCQGLIARYKCPRIVQFRTLPFPVSGAGKILKRMVRQELMHGLSKSVESAH